jgi:hypothetical protein
MITEDAFPVEPWCVRETQLNLDLLAQSESLFALSNGHIGLRGNLDEAEPYGLPGTYLNSFYVIRPLPYAEAGYGYPEAGQTVVDVTNGKIPNPTSAPPPQPISGCAHALSCRARKTLHEQPCAATLGGGACR